MRRPTPSARKTLNMNNMFFPLFCNGYVAQLCGEKAAIIFHQISYLIYNNQNDGIGFYDGKFWMTKTLDAWGKYYPNMTAKQVFLALKSLENEGLIDSSKFNTDSFNQTKWYSITEKGWHYVSFKFKNENIDFPKMENGMSSNPDFPKMENVARANKELYILDNINVSERERAREGKHIILNKPSGVKEVIEEAGKRRCVINEQQAQDFIDKFEAISENGTWVKGRNVVTDWRKLITSGWIKCWQSEFRKSMEGTPDDGRLSREKFAAEIAAERAALGLS